MANISSCDPEVLSEVPYSDSYPNDMINQDVQEMQYSEQTHVYDFQDNEIHSDKLKKEEVGEQPQRQLCAATTFQETNMKRAYTTGPGEKKECQDFTLRDEIYGIIIVYHITIHKD
ncbi:hypothetical protein Tco_0513894 [Tanacetum coccineum]